MWRILFWAFDGFAIIVVEVACVRKRQCVWLLGHGSHNGLCNVHNLEDINRVATFGLQMAGQVVMGVPLSIKSYEPHEGVDN